MSDTGQVTALLRAHSAGSPDALDAAVPLVYQELRRLAAAQLARERAGHTLSATALVHEAYVRLVDIQEVDWEDRVHFFAVAARVMRRILVDHARARSRAKRGGGAAHLPLPDGLAAPAVPLDDVLALDSALSELSRHSLRQSRVVECRCFAGLTVAETARALGASEATVKRDWAFARAWLNHTLRGDADTSAPRA